MLTWSLACAAGVAVTLVGEGTGNQPARAAGKLTAAASFLGAAWSADLVDLTPHGTWVVAGLALSALGDALLLSNDKKVFLSGLVAFLLAHLCYAAGFAALGPTLGPMVVGSLSVLALGAVVLRWMGDRAGRMAYPIAAYVVAISAMVGTGVGTGLPALAVGAVAFALSDVFVARQRFIAPTPWNRYIGLPLYFGAQLLLIWGSVHA